LGEVRWAPLGLVGMLNSGGAVVSTRLRRAGGDLETNNHEQAGVSYTQNDRDSAGAEAEVNPLDIGGGGSSLAPSSAGNRAMKNDAWSRGAEAEVVSRAAGRFLAYCAPRPASVWREGSELGLPFSYDAAAGLLAVQLDGVSAEQTAKILVQW